MSAVMLMMRGGDLTEAANGLAKLLGGLSVVVGQWGAGLSDAGIRADIQNLQSRNVSVFNQMAAVKNLDNPQLGERRWTVRQEDISYQIRAKGIGWNWGIFRHDSEGKQQVDLADRAHIALVPHSALSSGARLKVTDTHGCLSVPFNAGPQEGAAYAIRLLETFRKKVGGGGEYRGVYDLSVPDGMLVYAPSASPAMDNCPAALPDSAPVRIPAPGLAPGR